MLYKTLPLLILAAILAIAGGGPAFAGEKKAKDKAQHIFVDYLDVPVDAAWDAARRCIYVSNGNGFTGIPAAEKEGDMPQTGIKDGVSVHMFPNERFGLYKSYVLPNFEVKASCGGILLVGDTLYIADLGNYRIRLYDLLQNSVVNDYYFDPEPDTVKPRLRDLCMDSSGNFYASDVKQDGIYIKEQTSASFTLMELSGEQLREPVGMHFDMENNRLIVVENIKDSAAIKAVDLDNDSCYTVKQTPYGSLVGITEDAYGYYHFSNQYDGYGGLPGGNLYSVDTAFTGNIIPLLENAFGYFHDIVCIPEMDTMLIPIGDKLLVIGFLRQTPSTIYPANNSTNIESNIEFEWTPVQNAYGYEIQISTSLDFTNSIKKYKWQSGSMRLIDDLEPGNQYYWRVKAWSEFDDGMQSAWSDTAFFVMSDTLKPGPRKIYPAEYDSLITDKLTFSWEPVEGAGKYHIVVAKDSLYDNLEIDAYSDTTSIYYKYLNLEVPYYWKVKATGGLCGTEWSESSTFTTREPLLDQVELLSPFFRAAFLPLNLELIWDSVANASQYVIQVEPDAIIEDNPFSTFVNDSTTEVLYSLDGLYALGYFKWRVKAINGENSGKWSEVGEFSTSDTIIPPPLLIGPTNKNNSGTYPTFYWKNAYVDYYEIQVASMESSNLKVNFLNPLISRSYISDTLYKSELILDSNSKYLWRIRAVLHNRTTSRWSDISEFATSGNSVKEGIRIDDLIKVIPNPVNTSAKINISLKLPCAISLSLYNSMGQKVNDIYSGNFNGDNLSLDLNTASLESGVYYIRLNMNGMEISKKIVIVK